MRRDRLFRAEACVESGKLGASRARVGQRLTSVAVVVSVVAVVPDALVVVMVFLFGEV